MHERVQSLLYEISVFWYCHQLSERSFFVRGRQCPLCARCLGILVGMLGVPIYARNFSWPVSVVLVCGFFFDSITQLLRFRKSNNWLRFASGAGFSLAVSSSFVKVGIWLLSTT